mmetsp:Transcript_41683/g.93647  ORF Transcript_41683/g.93647 Transcript_41683/m.93647 type:complete len:576 (+) Transcript_41683:124-1851(+)
MTDSHILALEDARNGRRSRDGVRFKASHSTEKKQEEQEVAKEAGLVRPVSAPAELLPMPIISALAREEHLFPGAPALRDESFADTGWSQVTHGRPAVATCQSSRSVEAHWRMPPGVAANTPTPASHMHGTVRASEQLQLVLYHGHELVLYDRHQNRAFARRLTEEQAQTLTKNPHRFCPLCRQRLNPSWAFVVEGYFEMLRVMNAGVPMPAPGSTEEAARELHSIPKGLLNSGYYERFFVEEHKLGSGSFGAVYRCRHVMDEIELGVFAVKKLALGDDTARLRQVMREVKALERLRHMNVVDYKHSWLEVSRHSEFCPYVPFLFILMEFCNAGSLEGLIWPKGFVRGAKNNAVSAVFLSETLIWILFRDVCRGLAHLHSHGILHRDLKPSNILLHIDEAATDMETSAGAAPIPRALLSDFGTSEMVGERVGAVAHGGYAIEFASPERLCGEDSEEPADMWSAGLVLYAMCYGDLPYHADDPEDCRRMVEQHALPFPLPSWRDEELKQVVHATTNRNPAARLTAAEAEARSDAMVARETERRAKGTGSGPVVPHHALELTDAEEEVSLPPRSVART